ncbi:MAG: hypothetical protein NZL94_10615 [Meiothermus sp.]|uniref:hypothetical protein n=1 Tax=Meiothermus sp. TaxID=1955249 RepID=UPI002612DBED|nr:hypothetical protein [Meiothermus sp.]MCS7059319.1 hypothetical protein [Meiothermus sp.]MCX7740736.1 hypothetical protein [Meiothermus sp.]MDW8482139.1 hypothetical protein [Meiothermus sp.]
MRWTAGVLLGGLALAQSLTVAPEGRVGEPLEIQGAGFPPGRHTLTIESDTGRNQAVLEAAGEQFTLAWTPPRAGVFRISVELQGRRVEAQTRVVAQASLPTPQLGADGLVVGSWKLPLTGPWIGPKVLGSRAFIAQGPLVLEIDLQTPRVVAEHFPPAEVRALETEPEPAVLLEDGRRLSLAALAGKPYEGRWESLSVLRDYFKDREPTSAQRPYWYYFTREASSLNAADLEAIGRDLLQRGHRPELAWGRGVLRWLEPWLAQVRATRREGLEKSLTWSEFFLKYLPQLPGAQAVLLEQADWLEAQGRPDLAERYRDALREVASWQPPLTSAHLAQLTGVLGGLYLLMVLYLSLLYLPAQLRGVRPSGGWLLGWLRHPLLRLRHSVLAYTTIGERALLLLLFGLTILAFLAWGFLGRFEALIAQESLTRGTLRSNAAQETLRNLANTDSARGLLAYALAQENPTEARRLYETAPAWSYVLLGRGTPEALAQAYRQAPRAPSVREALGLGGDLWSEVYREAGVAREAVPTPRVIAAALGLSHLRNLTTNFLEVWRDLPLWPTPLWAWGAAGLAMLLALYHLLCFFLPRPKNAQDGVAWRHTIQLLFPGSPTYSQGWGVLVLLTLGAGVWLWRQEPRLGLTLTLLALGAHLVLWLTLVYRR